MFWFWILNTQCLFVGVVLWPFNAGHGLWSNMNRPNFQLNQSISVCVCVCMSVLGALWNDSFDYAFIETLFSCSLRFSNKIHNSTHTHTHAYCSWMLSVWLLCHFLRQFRFFYFSFWKTDLSHLRYSALFKLNLYQTHCLPMIVWLSVWQKKKNKKKNKHSQ